ncbi:MAG TPA: branched-chain amino acid ABC transporter permease [Stellaceae bacterium]|nr:branched-chain amino acid ABC transporter permease [Stellaceae bacterium]
MTTDAQASRIVRDAFSRHPLSWIDALPWVAVAGLYFAAGTYLPLGTQVMIAIIFALALDLALGFGGIATLGHAAFFGLGAYAAGLYALDISTEPISGLVAAGLVGGIGGLIAGPLVLRTRGLTLVMLTLAVATLLHELANSFKSVTGGADGLFGYKIAPVFGIFSFDLAGRTAYWYGAAVMAVVFFLCKALVNSPFGLAVRGIRENQVRMRMLGVPVISRLVMLYAISGALAAVAGGLSAQVTKLVGLDSLTFTLSGNVLVMLILGGTGSLYGAFLGATLFVVLSDRAAAVDPFNWLFAVGIVLILAVRYAPQGLVGLIEQLAARAGWGRGRA